MPSFLKTEARNPIFEGQICAAEIVFDGKVPPLQYTKSTRRHELLGVAPKP